ncbi:right-handed parallel beta-helix repeat-containing protein [Halorussus amylolyticus]|uniref:right-handed parallel beta-helix repeat-containing protein n=1 Tax=Halorussus amylolyticus TaxID=1126242 RepID=UPI00104CAC77|nr:right-handed parallel beta-helix repeat-containing protein [Halorussus amylolyticus]
MVSTCQGPGVKRDESSSARRSYLRAVGAAAVAATLAGCGEWGRDPDPTETTRRETETPTTDATTPDTTEARETTESEDDIDPETTDRFENVVNVADAGADTSGGDPVNAVLDEHLADNTLFYFPEGRYRLRGWRVVDYRNVGVVGDDAVLVPPDGKQDYWLMWDELRDLVFTGFTLDCTAQETAPVNYITVTGGDNVVRDVALRGHRQVPRGGFEIAVADPDSRLLFENVRLPDGSTAGNAIYTFPKSVGTLVVRDCRVEHWAEGLYASPHSGPLEVVGGYYANCGIDQVRVGGGPSGAVVRGVTVRVDDPRQPDSKPNMRGIWMEEGASVRIRNCDVAITDLTGTYSSGAIVVGQQFGSATVENTRVRTDASARAIHVRKPVDSIEGQTMPSMNSLPENWGVTCRNVRIEGSASSGAAIRASGRDNCTFENICIRHASGSRDGVFVTDAEGCAVRDSLIAVSGRTITTRDANVRTNGNRRNGSC